MEQNMTPEQALEILDQVSSKFQGVRKDHMMITAAIEVLHQAIVKLRQLDAKDDQSK